jgi:hypothetical protein
MLRLATRKRVIAAIVTLAVGLAIVAGVVIGNAGESSSHHQRHPTQTPWQEGQARPALGERLIPELTFIATRPAAQAPADFDIPFFEVLPDGTVIDAQWDIPDGMALTHVRSSSDGHVLALATHDLMPGVPREGGPNVEGVSFPLLAIDPTGTISLQRDVRITGEWVSLIGVTPTDAVLQRYAPSQQGHPVGPVRIVAHNLTTGEERMLAETNRGATQGDISGDRLVLAGDMIGDVGGSCWVQVSAVTTEDTAPLHSFRCDQIIAVNAAPDGRAAAIVYEQWVGDAVELRLVVFDLDHMALIEDEFLNRSRSCTSCLYPANAGYLGMAWDNTSRLRIALMDPIPLDVDPAHVLGEIQARLRTEIHTTTN